MPLLRIQSYPGFKQVFIAGEGIADLATVELLPGERQVKMGATDDEHLAAGVARGAAVSGALVRVVTQGIMSGVKTALAVQAGDRLTIATSGRVVPLNTIQPTAVSGAIGATISGLLASGAMASGAGMEGFSGFITSGYTTLVLSGQLTGMAFNTGRLVGRALTSGLSGLGIQMLVSLG